MSDDSGLQRIKQRLKSIPHAVEVEVRKAMETSAAEIVALAKALCPVDEGALRNSIGWTWGNAPNHAVVLAQSVSAGDLAITIYAGNDEAFYARWVEFGTQSGVLGRRVASTSVRSGHRKSYRTHPGTSAQPFFFPAYRLEQPKAAARVKRAVSKAIKKNWGKS